MVKTYLVFLSDCGLSITILGLDSTQCKFVFLGFVRSALPGHPEDASGRGPSVPGPPAGPGSERPKTTSQIGLVLSRAGGKVP